MSEKISIVVPVYNVEMYLPFSLDSILEQTYKNIEVLLINDGSPDNCGAICDAYAAKDSRVRVFHNENQGVARSRQFGVENSTSDYIIFVDSDDWLTADAVEVLYNAITSDIDIVLSAAIYHRKKGVKPQALSSRSFNPMQYLTAILLHEVKVVPWGKLFRKSLFEEDSFPKFSRGQDWLMNINLATNCRKAKIIPHYTYNYRADSSTSSIKSFTRTFAGHERFCLVVKDTLKAKNLYDNNLSLYARLLFKSMSHLPFKGVRIDYSNPLIKEMFDNLDYSSLSTKYKFKYFVIKYKFLSRAIAYLRK